MRGTVNEKELGIVVLPQFLPRVLHVSDIVREKCGEILWAKVDVLHTVFNALLNERRIARCLTGDAL